MLDLTPSLRQKLDQRATTFCHCWRLTRRDGAVMGFTDHDRDLSFGDVVFRAHTGLSPSEAEGALGLSVATFEAAGALTDDGLTETDLLKGFYDGASVETWLVDWTDARDRTLLDIATIGEVRRGENAFSAELRSNAHYFNQPQGRVFQRACNAELGDQRCKVELHAFASSGTVAAFKGGVLALDLARACDSGFFAGGKLTFASGANAAASMRIKSHRQETGVRAAIELWTPPAAAISSGDAVSLTAGCDKSASTCKSKFNNIIHFRGFPHMPGNDAVIAYPNSRSQEMDGGSFFR